MPLFESSLRIRLGRLRQEGVARLLSVVPRSSLRLMPGTSETFGPPRRSATVQEYLREHPGSWSPVSRGGRSSYPRPHSLEKDAAILDQRFGPVHWGEAGVAVLPGGRVLDSHAWPVGENDIFLHEFGFLGERAICPIYLTTRLQKPIYKTGSALNLGSCWAANNYGHFLFDALPRLEFFHRAGFSLSQIDHIVVPRFAGPSGAKIIERLGLPAEKLLRLAPGEQYRFDLLYQPSYPGASAYYRPEMAEFYRRPEFETEPSGPRRRLYVPRRGGVRQISNESDVSGVLADSGFETVDFRKISDDCAYFRDAEIVVGPHGAGLANLVFCGPGTRFVELLPHNHVYPFYYSAACAAGLEYWALLGQAEGSHRANEFAPPTDANFRVDPGDLARVLQVALAGELTGRGTQG